VPSGGAFLLHDHKTHDLNALVHPASQFYLMEANDISNSGLIVGEGRLPGSHIHAFMLTPIDADLDDDGDVDHNDYRLLADCSSGPDVPPQAPCLFADLDQSGTVDLVDFRSMQLLLTAN